MPGRRSFKSDESFLEKISMGATGTRQVFTNLQNRGHNPLELERGSRSFKLWKRIKIKRIRVPDVLCVNCARRVESRAKTALEISMSHSISDPERGWDGGLRDDDYVALVVCEKTGTRAVDWRADELVQYISVQAMRAAVAEDRIELVTPKGAEEGFEQRMIWPSVEASASGSVVYISDDRLQYRRATDNRIITLRLKRKNIHLLPLVQLGDQVRPNQVLAAVVPVEPAFECTNAVPADHYVALLSSHQLSDQYAAAKALQKFPAEEVVNALIRTVDRADQHIYVRLEAAASLARHGHEQGWQFISTCLRDTYLENRLEAVIVLGEIQGGASRLLLADVLQDRAQHAEIRAGAAWALGELRDREALGALVESFNQVDEIVRLEATRALAKLAADNAPELMGELGASAPEVRPGIAWALSQAGKFDIDDLLGVAVDNDARQWIAYMVGTQDPERYVNEIEHLRARDPEIYFAVTVLWKIISSWIHNLEEY